MTDQGRLIDQIVQGVLRDLGGPPQTVRADMASGGRQPPDLPVEGRGSRVEERKTEAAITLNERVITGELLEQRVNGQARIRIAPGSVLTPTARDFMRSRGIEIVREATGSRAAAADSHWSIVVGSSTDALKRALGDGASRTIASCEKPKELAHLAVSRIANRETAGAVVFTHNPEAVACLANRTRGIRATVVTDVPAFQRASARIGANVIAVDPSGQSYFELYNLLKQVVSKEVPQPPPDWPEQFGERPA